jgi:hypothetical protein
MSRGRLHSITKTVTKDVFDVILKCEKPRTRRRLPGRKSIYIWDESFKRDVDADPDVPGFIVRLEVLSKECEHPSIDAEAGEEDGDVIIWLNVHFDHRNLAHRNELYQELVGVVRHEVEHLSMIGPLTMPGPAQKFYYGENIPTSGKVLHDINRRRKLFGKSGFDHKSWGIIEKDICEMSANGCFKSYIMSYDELGPFVVGFMTQARATRVSFETIASEYLDYFVGQKRLSQEDKAHILDWIMIWARDKYPNNKLVEKHLHI